MPLLLLALACRPGPPALTVPDGPLRGDVAISLTGNADTLSILVDDAEIASGEGPSLATTWDSTTVEDGPHVVSGLAVTGNGEPRRADVNVDVDQTSGLAVSFLSPTDGATVAAGDVAVSLDVTNPEELAALEVTVDGVAIAAPPVEGPWTTTWTGATAGAHSLGATATSGTGASATASIAVTVGAGEMSCRFTGPEDGAEVPVITALRADASSDARLESAKFRVDGALLETDTVPPWLHWWDASASVGASATLEVELLDAAGTTCTDAVAVTVEADPAFQVVITQPAENGRVSGAAVPIKALMAGGAGAERGELYVDDVLVATDDASEWSFQFDSTAFANGDHEVRVVGYELGTGATAEDGFGVTVAN